MSEPAGGIFGGASSPSHLVQFYETDKFLCDGVTRFLHEGLRHDDPVLMITTQTHRKALIHRLRGKGIDVANAEADQRLIILDARRTLAAVRAGGLPGDARFRELMDNVLGSVDHQARGRQVRVYSEMIDLLWREGETKAALRFEELWNDLARRHSVSLLCAYVMDSGHPQRDLPALCEQHDHALAPEPSNDERVAPTRLLVAEVSRRMASERALRDSLREQHEGTEALRRAEQQARVCKEELQHFLDTAVVPIHTINKHGVITWANQAELDMLGYTADEYIGHPLHAFQIDPSVAEGLFARVLGGEVVHDAEIQLRAKDGTIRHVLISSRAYVKAGKFVSTRCFSRDITERKRGEQERDRLIEDLTRTVRLNEMFAGVLAHDLRTPLTTIVMAGQLAMARVDNAYGKDALQRLLRSATRMQLMIEQLLDVSRARTGGGIPLECRPTDLGGIVHDVVEELHLAHPDATIEPQATGDLHGAWDADRLAQLVSNLVGNAVQHGRSDAPITIRIDGTRAESVALSIANAGTLREDLLPLLFTPFRGAQQRSARTQGLGLGLFISDQIVRAHGGTLGVTSQDGRTEFTTVLPRTPAIGPAVTSFDARAAAPTELHDTRRAGVITDQASQILIQSVRDYAIFMLDPDGHVATWNAGAARIKGYGADEIVGKHFSTFYPETDLRAGKPEHALEVATRDGRFEDEGWRVRKDGSRFWANVVITALHDANGKPIGFAKITRDLTERKKHEDNRIRLAQAEEAVRLRDEFLSIASHELKTPLSVLRMQLETLRKRFDESDPAIATKLERMHRAGQRLTELVEMLFDVSRIVTGRFELRSETFDLTALVREIVDRMCETASASRCTVTCKLEATLQGTWDRLRVDQLITNLLANAFKYAAGTPIELTLHEQDDTAVLEVRDRGPGLPAGREATMFGRFERAASMQHHAGFGLGLYVVEQIVRAHGGTASAANASGGGAYFRVELPVSPKAMLGNS